MQKIKVNYIFRKRGEGHNSIEELFQSIIAHLPKEIEAKVVELPYGGASLKAVLGNIWHVLFLKDIIHVTGDVYYIGLIPLKKTILTVHDTHFIKGSFIKKRLLKWFWVVLPVLFSKQITVISQFSENTLLKLVPWAKGKVRVIYNPVNHLLAPYKKTFKNPPVILHLGTKTNKNLINTVKALSGIPCKLIILGTLSAEQEQALKQYDIKYNNEVRLPFSEIKKCYETCDMVSFISLNEGFGMPIIEAQSVGRVVITSDKTSIPEVAGDAAYVVDPINIEEIHAGFKLLINNEKLRNELIEKGFKNVSRFQMQATVNQYVRLYRELNQKF